MKDLIAKLQLDANCALGAIWMHIDAQAARIAELEAQIAAASAPVVDQRDLKRELILKAQAILAQHLPPCGTSEKETISALLWLLDGPESRAALAASQLADTDKLREAILALNPIYTESNWGGGFQDCRWKILRLLDSTALQAPVREVPEGMPVSQEPKYGIRDNRLFNRASGETIPEDEPVFIFRARDTHAVNILAGYAREVLNAEHASAVWGRVDDFKRF